MDATTINCRRVSRFLIRFFIFLVILFCAFNSGYSQNMPVPENIQAALLPKVLKFNSNFSDKSNIRMLIVFDHNSRINKDEFLIEISSVMEVKAVTPEELELNIINCDLVYFMPGLQNNAEICKRHQVLSVTGISQYVEEGKVSLAFGIQNNKPKIFVNINLLESEGQNLSSDILRIAKVYN